MDIITSTVNNCIAPCFVDALGKINITLIYNLKTLKVYNGLLANGTFQ